VEKVIANRFAIEGEAGTGTTAHVYRARDTTTGSTVALKILKVTNGLTLARFAREVDALSELDHTNIVRYIAHGTTASGAAYLAMEWLVGESLDERLKRGPLDTEQAITVARCIASALGAAHARGLVHRDVKPANIFLVEGDPARTKLLDFGIARDTLATFGLTNTGDLLGTPMFMAPEQVFSAFDVDARCDVYALGAVIYNCLVGQPPFHAANLTDLFTKLREEQPPALTGVAAPIAELVARLLAKKPEDRPCDGAAAAAALDDACGVHGFAGTIPAR
jgi:eukaryotic-like serine/threonine-protein kinase